MFGFNEPVLREIASVNHMRGDPDHRVGDPNHNLGGVPVVIALMTSNVVSLITTFASHNAIVPTVNIVLAVLVACLVPPVILMPSLYWRRP